MPNTLLLALLAFAALAWFWQDGLRAREQALALGRRACRQVGVQLLDETVVLQRIRLSRTANGGIGLARRYDFEFTVDGDERRQGRILLLSRRLQSIQLDLPEGMTLLEK